MLALAEAEARTCSGCSSDLHVSMDDASFAERRLWVEDGAVCHVCAGVKAHRRALERTHEKDPAWWDGRMVHGYLVDRGVTTGGDSS